MPTSSRHHCDVSARCSISFFKFRAYPDPDELRYTRRSTALPKMNGLERLFCSSSCWRYLSRRAVLPWILSGSRLGDHILEIGAGYGAATRYLGERVARVSSLEFDLRSLAKLKKNNNGMPSDALCGNASQLPFADQSFSSAVAILVLHHLKSQELQDMAFAEAFRVLRPGGVFLAFEILESWIHHVGHIGSTYTPVGPGSSFARLSKSGFSRTTVDFRLGVFRIAAHRPV